MKASAILTALALFSLAATGAFAGDTVVSGLKVMDKDLVVGKGDTVRLMPGARLLFKEGTGIRVEGTLEAAGKAGRQAALAPAKEGVQWLGITVVSGGSARLVNCSISGAVEAVRASGGSLALKGVIISGCEKGVTVEMMSEAEVVGLKTSAVKKAAFSVRQDSKAALKDCSFSGPGGSGLSVTGKCCVTISGSGFDGLDCGIRATYPGASPEVRDCTFSGNKYGVFTEFPDASPRLALSRFTGNTYGVYSKRLSSPNVVSCGISGNEYGIYATEGSSPAAAGSHITKNRYGVYVTFSSYPKVNGCDLSGNSVYAVYLDEQSGDWISANGDLQRRQKMGMRAMAAGQRGSETRRQGMEAARYVNPKGGYVDFQHNYWGEAATKEMGASSGQRDTGAIYDYFDKDSDIYDGKRYIRDKVDYTGYLSRNPVNQ